MPKLTVNQPFNGLLRANDYAIIPVATGDGRVTIKRINPGNQLSDWFLPQWGKDPESGRITSLLTVDLTAGREAAGCTFLQHDYEAEGFDEGWRAFQDYIEFQFFMERDGKKIRRRKPLDVDPFPDHLLPKRVLDRRVKAAKASAKWEPPKDVKHPEDKPKGK